MAKMIEGDLRIPKMYNFIFTIIFDFRPKVDGVILPSPLKWIYISLYYQGLWAELLTVKDVNIKNRAKKIK